MRILVSCQQALRPHAVPAYAFWERYFKAGLEEAGHSWIEIPAVDWAEGLTMRPAPEHSAWRTRTWESALRFAREEHRRHPVDLFLSYLFPQQVEPAAVASVRALGIPCVNFFCDNVREFTRVPEAFRGFDLHWVPEWQALAMYRAAGLPALWAPMPVWVPPDYRSVPAETIPATVFIGSHDELREALLAEAITHGLSLRVHGVGWSATPQQTGPSRRWLSTVANQAAFLRRFGPKGWAVKLSYRFRPRRDLLPMRKVAFPTVSVDEYLRISRECEVLLGINRYPDFRHFFSHPDRYYRLRDIEAPMLGACYLTEDAPGLADLYEIGTEIETYRTAAELAEKATRLRAEPERRARLRAAGQRRALAHHTVGQSVRGIADQLGVSQ